MILSAANVFDEKQMTPSITPSDKNFFILTSMTGSDG